MAINNTTYRLLVEKLGGADPSTFVGSEGEVFYDPDAGSPTLRLSDGSTAGGIAIGGGGGGDTGNWTFSGDYASTPGGELGIDGVLVVNTIEGTGAEGVNRMLLQASGNGNSYISIPTDSASTTNNLVIGNEARGIQLVGAVVLDGEIYDPNLTGGSNVTPTNIPLTQGYVILNEGAGGLGYFNLPDGQEGQIIHLVMGSTDSLTANEIHVIMDSGRYLFNVGDGNQQVFTGALDVQPFTEIPTAMVTMIYAGGYWTVTHGTVAED